MKAEKLIAQHYTLIVILLVLLTVIFGLRHDVGFHWVHVLWMVACMMIAGRAGYEMGTYKRVYESRPLIKVGQYKVPNYIKKFMLDAHDIIDHTVWNFVANTEMRTVEVRHRYSAESDPSLIAIAYEMIEEFPDSAIDHLHKEYQRLVI